MKTALITLSDSGVKVIKEIAAGFTEADLFVHKIAAPDSDGAYRFTSIVELTASIFHRYENIVYAVPCGIVVRAIAPLLKTKHADPAVVVVDAGKRFVVSLLSGHEGGANDLAFKVGNLIGAEPVITTTTEATKMLVVGIGCRRGVNAENIIEAVQRALDMIGATSGEVRLLSSVDIKCDEDGLLQASASLGIPIRFISSGEIREAKRVFAKSHVALKKVGLPAVAEPAALLAGKGTKLILGKTIWKNVTVAIAKENSL